MERASKLIRQLHMAGEPISNEQVACAAWPQSVGKKIANHTRPARLIRKRLVIEVEDRTWQRQLMTLSQQILASLERNLGRGAVEDLEFRVTPKRREPQRAAASISVTTVDEADAITDPILRSLYKTSRKRSLA
jgi:predicted nucleic acid-binding Zn ribbon protein